MKILWLINVPLVEASLLLNEKPSPFGGWLINASKTLSLQENIKLTIAFPHSKANEIEQLKGKRINYYPFTPIENNDNKVIKNNKTFTEILRKETPDIVHIFGTEMAHTLSMINACRIKNIKTVVSIQGLVSVISRHYMANLPLEIQKRFTFRDFVKQDNLLQQQKKFLERGITEIEAIKKTNHIIGRTTWDKACTSQINPIAQYHFCNETLREVFYKHEWSIETCEKYSIFISQGSYPIKGLHSILKAMPLVLKKFPEAKIYIAGHDIVNSDTIKEILKQTSYAKYIEKLVRKYNLKNNISFTGILEEKEMCTRYLKSHVFVCPSFIENSPNSLGEAMLLGIPCVASYVGGIPDMLKDKEEGFLYQHDASYMLAHYICELFENNELAMKFSQNARQRALKTHDREENTRELMGIYNKIMSS